MNENILNIKNREYLRKVLLDQWEVFWRKDLGIKREELKLLKKFSKGPQAVIVSGLRRVGKSTLLAQMSHKIGEEKLYYLNLEDERLLGLTVGDLSQLHFVLGELFGERKIFILDEVQNVNRWEIFVRRLIDEGYKFYLSGSNASLLSQELGTKLTGRYLPIELYPFSFKEFLKFKKEKIPDLTRLTTSKQNRTLHLFQEYLKLGGIPDALKYPQINLHQTLYNDVLYRDIATRYQITETKALKELTFYLVSNISRLVSFNKLKEMLKLGSVNTVKNYIDYLEISWLLFSVNSYAYSIKKQQIAPKKIYGIDTGLVYSLAFSFSKNYGYLLENLVFLSLRKKYKEVFYYKTAKGYEVDFYIPKDKLLIQVAQDLSDEETKDRELKGLIYAMGELKTNKALILTELHKETLNFGKNNIIIKPVYEWLLKD